MHSRSLDGIYHFDRVIPERRNKDPPRLRGIETEMVEPPVNARERYLGCQDERTVFLFRSALLGSPTAPGQENRHHCQADGTDGFHAYLQPIRFWPTSVFDDSN